MYLSVSAEHVFTSPPTWHFYHFRINTGYKILCVELPASLEITVNYSFTLSQMGAMFILNYRSNL
jgi:hypothetical protein